LWQEAVLLASHADLMGQDAALVACANAGQLTRGIEILRSSESRQASAASVTSDLIFMLLKDSGDE